MTRDLQSLWHRHSALAWSWIYSFILKNVYTSLFFLEPNVCIYEMLKDVLYKQEMLTHFDTSSL